MAKIDQQDDSEKLIYIYDVTDKTFQCILILSVLTHTVYISTVMAAGSMHLWIQDSQDISSHLRRWEILRPQQQKWQWLCRCNVMERYGA